MGQDSLVAGGKQRQHRGGTFVLQQTTPFKGGEPAAEEGGLHTDDKQAKGIMPSLCCQVNECIGI